MGGGGGSGRWSSLGDIRSLEERAKKVLQEGRKNVFISFAHEDMDEVNLLRAHAKNEKSEIEFNDRSVQEPYDSDRAEYIRSRLADRINQASVTIVYLSDSTAQSQWVKWEVEKSIELGKKVIVMHAGKEPPKNTPSWVRKYGLKVKPWSKLSDEL